MEAQGKPIRKVIHNEVEKVLGCGDVKNGYQFYVCPNCQAYKYVAFTCKSRFCNSCGAKYSNDRALAISKKLLDCSHRHVVFTIPQELRPYFAYDRSLLNLLFKAASETIYYHFHNKNKSQDYVPGMVCVLHTFGRDLKWNPHIHMILSEGAIGNSGAFVEFNHINYQALRHSWQYLLLKYLLEHIKDPLFKTLVDSLYRNNQNGFYVRALPNKNMNNSAVSTYIVRYIGRPAMAQSRITNYDGKTVTFFYVPHGSDKVVHETLSVFDFIKKLIIHIPEHNFKMLRYYGLYCVNHLKHKLYLLLTKRMSKAHSEFLTNAFKKWRSRITYFFKSDPLKCICGHYLELADVYNPHKKWNSP